MSCKKEKTLYTIWINQDRFVKVLDKCFTLFPFPIFVIEHYYNPPKNQYSIFDSGNFKPADFKLSSMR